MAGNLNIKNANGKTLTIQNPDTNNVDIVIDGSKIASTESPTLTGNPTAPTQIAQNNSTRIATTAYVDGKFIISAAVATTSGTSIDFTGIPSWAKRITIMFDGVSTSGSSPLRVLVGSGSFDTTGYKCLNSVIGTDSAASIGSTSGFLISINTGYNDATDLKYGVLTLLQISSNTWVISGNASNTTVVHQFSITGSKTTSGALDRVRFTTVNGTDTFDAGSVNIMYEG